MWIRLVLVTAIVVLIITMIMKIQEPRAYKDLPVNFTVRNMCEELDSQSLCADMADICQWNPLLQKPKCTKITRKTGLGARGESLERSASQL